MASLKKLPKSNSALRESNLLFSRLNGFFKHLFRDQGLARPKLTVAFSGGLDSTVLLNLMHQLQNEIPFYLRAIHVNHGLSEHADDWANFCNQTCIDLNVPINIIPVSVDLSSGIGVEAAARHARYQVLNAIDADLICLGHHQDDQAETFLLQLARGAGVKGLAGMAEIDLGRRLVRPLLNVKQTELRQYAEHHQLKWIVDESNENQKFDRNFVRHTLIPTFNKRYTDVTNQIARAAMHMGEANVLLDDLASIDSAIVLEPAEPFDLLKLEALYTLSQARQANFIRWWLAKGAVGMPSAEVLKQIVSQLKSKKTDASIKIKVSENLYVMRYQKMAYLVSIPPIRSNINLLWQGEEIMILPDQSRLFFIKKLGEGFAYKRGGSNIKLRIKNREGGEYFKPSLERPRRHLKTIMQSLSIPPWQREQLPLVFMDETLVIIPNYGVNAEMKAKSHEDGLIVNWEPNIS